MQVSRERFYRLSQELEGRAECIEDLRAYITELEDKNTLLRQAIYSMQCTCLAPGDECERCHVVRTLGEDIDD